MTTVAVVREAGGMGDTLSVTAAIYRYKQENPSHHVTLWLPDDFADLACLFKGPDCVRGLGATSTLAKIRRHRDTPMEGHGYLSGVMLSKPDRIVDAYCPSFLYESSCEGPLLYNRPQLFAMAMGCKDVSDVRPVAKPPPAGWWNLPWPPGVIMDSVVLAPRATCPCRTIPISVQERVAVDLLAAGHNVVYCDCIEPKAQFPRSVYRAIGLPPELLMDLVRACRYVICADSFMFHLAASVSKPCTGVFGPTDGQNTARTYPQAHAIDGRGEVCTLPCNYNGTAKLWQKSCRESGCERMASHDPDRLMAAIMERLR